MLACSAFVFNLKHSLCVLVRTANLCFEQKLDKNVFFFFSSENYHFLAFKNRCILQWHVFVIIFFIFYHSNKPL